MVTKDIFPALSSFTCGEETLDIMEIMSKRKIISIRIAFLEKEKKFIFNWLNNLFYGISIYKQVEREIIITDSLGIKLLLPEGPTSEIAQIRFSESKEFKKLDENFDPTTLGKRYILSIIQPYELTFNLRNLRELDWEIGSQ